MTIAPLLVEARVAIVKHELADALVPLLRAWASVRAPELADTIERISNSLRRTRSPVGGSTHNEIDEAWRRRAKQADPVEVGVLLACVAETDASKARKRLKLLARHAPDPRLASTLVGLILAPPFNAAKFWEDAHELLLACADPRALARLERVPAGERSSGRGDVLGGQAPPKGWGADRRLDADRRRSVENLRTRLAKLTLELAADELAELGAIREQLDDFDASRPDPGPKLLAAILENPHVLEHREVYADYLLGIGDPRGEFIALQLADLRGELDEAGRTRSQTLLREYGSIWLGPVGRVLDRRGTRFEAGFLCVARLKPMSRSLEPLLDDPIWATVERLELAPIEFASAPIMRSLRSLSWTVETLIVAGRRSPSLPAVTELHLERSLTRYDDADWAAERLSPARSVLEDLVLLPALTRVRLDPDDPLDLDELAWLWAGPLGQRLERIELVRKSAALGLAACVRSIRTVESQTLTEVEIRNTQLACRILRTDDGFTRVELRPGSDPSPHALADELEAIQRMIGIELVLDPGLPLTP